MQPETLFLSRYLQRLKSLQSYFDYFKISHISCFENVRTDSLSYLATSSGADLEKIFIEHLKSLRIDSKEKMHRIEVGQESS